MIKRITTFFLLLITATVMGQKTYLIDDPKDLQDVFYEAGDEIILKNGTYDTDGRAVFMGSGTAENPIVFRAETPGGVIFTGGMQLKIGGETDDDTDEILATGEYLVVDGFYWKGGYGSSSVIEFRNGYDHAKNSTIQNCVMDGLTVDPNDQEEGVSEKHNWIMMFGNFNTVINCSFLNKKSSGNMVLVDLAYNEWAPPYDDNKEGYETVNTSCDLVGHTISNNYFYNYEKVDSSLENAGDSETIRIGTSSNQNINSGTTVSNNYFVQADGENEIITNKSKNNTYINNTFRRSKGSLVLRHGSNASVEGNYFLGENIEGTGGIRIVDSYHTITNNYIQDCINVGDQAKWNNGITFLGGNEDAAVLCTSTDMSNGYQEVIDITLANNTIVNTNAPLYYNTDKGTTDPTGTVSNNLIYFADNNPNISDVITGDTEDSYNDLGTALDYTGNVYRGTALGTINEGFTDEEGIIASKDGEIFTFSGTEGKGANMGIYKPTTDDMVGYGIGACFLNYSGDSITDGDCTIEIPESIVIGSLPTFTYESSSNGVSVTANVEWTAESNNDWISIDTNSGTGDVTVSITTTENKDRVDRTGTVTFTQVPGGDNIVKKLIVIQEGAPRNNLINTGESDDPVSVKSFSSENSDKGEIATNTLDKDLNSIWAAQDGDVLTGDYKGDGEYIIYDLGSEYILDFIQFNTTNKSDAFGIQIWVSLAGTEESDFSMILPTTGDLLFTATGTTDFNKYEIDANARYVKLIGFGRFNADGDKRESAWTAIGEIDFYGTSSTLSTDNVTIQDIKLFPNPVTNGVLYLNKQSNNFDSLRIYDVAGKTILTKNLNSSLNKEEINVSSLSEGLYFVEITKGRNRHVNKIIISK